MAQRILIIEKTWLQKWNFKIKFQYDSIPSNSIFKRVGMVTACLHFKARHILQSASCRLHQSFCHFSPVNLLILVLKSRMVCSIWNFGMAGCAEKCQGKAYQGWASSECPKKRSALPLARTLRKLQWVLPCDLNEMRMKNCWNQRCKSSFLTFRSGDESQQPEVCKHI